MPVSRRKFGAAVAIVVVGNALLHTYFQDWRLTAPDREPSGYTGAVALVAVVASGILAIMMRNSDNIAFAIMPSACLGIVAFVAGVLGLPRVATWITNPTALALAREFESLFLALLTVWQCLVLNSFRKQRAPKER